MAITNLSTSGIKRMIGLSGDTKPTSQVPVGSTFLESDTSVEFTFTGSTWFATSSGAVGQQLAAKSQSVIISSDWVPPEIPLAANENYIGKVGGNLSEIYKNLTTTSTIHNAGDVVGGKQTLTNIARTTTGAMRLKAIWFFDVGGFNTVGYRFYYFNADPTAALADDAVWAWNAADYAKCIFVHDILPQEMSNDSSGPCWCPKVLSDFPLISGGAATIYVYIKCLNAVTPGATGNYHIRWLPDRD